MVSIIVHKRDDGKTFRVKMGTTIVIELPENPTSGFLWKFVKFEIEAISLKDSKFAISSDSAIGGGGTRTFTLNTLRKGSTKVGLRLFQDWAPDNIADSFEIIFVICD